MYWTYWENLGGILSFPIYIFPALNIAISELWSWTSSQYPEDFRTLNRTWLLLDCELKQRLAAVTCFFSVLTWSSACLPSLRLLPERYTVTLALPVFSHSFALSVMDLLFIPETLQLLCPIKGPLLTESQISMFLLLWFPLFDMPWISFTYPSGFNLVF